jgi:hypothetical protein
MPVSHHLDTVGVDTSTEEEGQHSAACCAKGTSIDIGGAEAIGSRGGGNTNCGGDKGRGDVGFAVSGVDVVEGREHGAGAVRTNVFSATNNRGEGTSDGVATASVRQDFALDHVFLVGELDLGTVARSKVSKVHVMRFRTYIKKEI